MKPIEPAVMIGRKGNNEPPKKVQLFWPCSAEGVDDARRCLVAKTDRTSAVVCRKIPKPLFGRSLSYFVPRGDDQGELNKCLDIGHDTDDVVSWAMVAGDVESE